MRCGLYIRVSTDHQVGRGASLGDQEERLRAFAEAKGWAVHDVYRDEGISAKDTDRPEFQRMRRDIEHGEIDAVLISKLDRAFRHTKDFLEQTEFFDEHGVKFVCLDADIDTTSAAGRLFSTMRAAFAEFERETTRERVTEVMLSRASKGKWNGGPVPFGFSRNGKDIEVNSEEAVTVVEIYELMLEKGSFRGVTQALNSIGSLTRQGSLWSVESVKRILKNPIYYGAYAYNRRKAKGKTSVRRPESDHIVIEGVYEPIVTKELFEEIQQIIRERRKIPPRSTNSPYLLTNIVRCEICDSRMHGCRFTKKQSGKTYRYYRCYGRAVKGPAACPGNSINGEFLDNAIVGELKAFRINPDKLKAAARKHLDAFEKSAFPSANQRNEIQTNLRQLERKKGRLLELFEDELIMKDEFSNRREVLDAERDFLRGEMEAVEGKLSPNGLSGVDVESALSGIRNLAEAYEELDFNDRRELLRTLISHVVVGRHNIKYGIYAIPPSVVDYNCMGMDSWLLPGGCGPGR